MTMTKKKHKTPERLLIEPEEKELAKTNNIVHQSIGTLLINLRKKSEFIYHTGLRNDGNKPQLAKQTGARQKHVD